MKKLLALCLITLFVLLGCTSTPSIPEEEIDLYSLFSEDSFLIANLPMHTSGIVDQIMPMMDLEEDSDEYIFFEATESLTLAMGTNKEEDDESSSEYVEAVLKGNYALLLEKHSLDNEDGWKTHIFTIGNQDYTWHEDEDGDKFFIASNTMLFFTSGNITTMITNYHHLSRNPNYVDKETKQRHQELYSFASDNKDISLYIRNISSVMSELMSEFPFEINFEIEYIAATLSNIEEAYSAQILIAATDEEGRDSLLQLVNLFKMQPELNEIVITKPTDTTILLDNIIIEEEMVNESLMDAEEQNI